MQEAAGPAANAKVSLKGLMDSMDDASAKHKVRMRQATTELHPCTLMMLTPVLLCCCAQAKKPASASKGPGEAILVTKHLWKAIRDQLEKQVRAWHRACRRVEAASRACPHQTTPCAACLPRRRSGFDTRPVYRVTCLR